MSTRKQAAQALYALVACYERVRISVVFLLKKNELLAIYRQSARLFILKH